jgi:RHS repeat-associated protein
LLAEIHAVPAGGELGTLNFEPATLFSWGRDLSGSLQGAGGVGGLLAISKVNPNPDEDEPGGAQLKTLNLKLETLFPTYDANGNVGQLINADANVVAAYAYDPFGNVTEMAGAEAAENPWRFSTKPVEAGTGWLYYGYRWYDAEMGRWVNRDPIEESGGRNLFSFVINSPGNWIDHLGLAASLPKHNYYFDECTFVVYWGHGFEAAEFSDWWQDERQKAIETEKQNQVEWSKVAWSDHISFGCGICVNDSGNYPGHHPGKDRPSGENENLGITAFPPSWNGGLNSALNRLNNNPGARQSVGVLRLISRNWMTRLRAANEWADTAPCACKEITVSFRASAYQHDTYASAISILTRAWRLVEHNQLIDEIDLTEITPSDLSNLQGSVPSIPRGNLDAKFNVPARNNP